MRPHDDPLVHHARFLQGGPRRPPAKSGHTGSCGPPTPPASELAQQATRDPYLFDFLTLHGAASEREVEDALVVHIERFLLELGAGFAFVGRQYHLEVGGDDCYIDPLFCDLKLRSFVVIELKARPFEAGDVGQLNLYLSAVDDLVRHPSDGPPIGLLLCKGKNRIKAEYALRGLHRPPAYRQWRRLNASFRSLTNKRIGLQCLRDLHSDPSGTTGGNE